MRHALLSIFSLFILLAVAPPAQAQLVPPAGTKVAFIGDTGNGTNFVNVLKLIKSQGAHAVIHLGDFDYNYDADGFFATVDANLGSNFPYFIAVGNHDLTSWNTGCGDPDGCYAQFQKDRLQRLSITPDDSNLNDQMYSLIYKNLKLVFVGQDGITAGDNTYAPFIKSQMQNDNSLWKICAWHKNQTEMQVGSKANEMGWNVYETCKDYGAIIATAHEHSYERTKTLTDFSSKIIDSSCNTQNKVCLAKGKSFAFVSGLGGNSIRNQDRCLPTTYPYGCNGLWAKIYTTDQNAQYGALFITFNINGNPNAAKGEFITPGGQIIDSFTIENQLTAPVNTPTPTIRPATPTPTRAASPTPTKTPSPTPAKTGDLDKDGDVDIFDNNLLVQNFNQTNCAYNLTGSCLIDIFDYNLLVQNFGQ